MSPPLEPLNFIMAATIRLMPRTDLYLKVVADHDEVDTPEKLAAEICRLIKKVHGVRSAELSSFITRQPQE
jgi:hypothetical protein